MATESDLRRTDAKETLAHHIEQNIESIVALQRREWESVGIAQRRVERVGRFIGRPVYLIGMLGLIGFWVVINAMVFTSAWHWDPLPFELLDGLMTLVSLVTTTIVLIAQNRQTKLEQQHTHLALQVSLLTEQKVTKMIGLLEELRRDLPMVKNRHDAHAEAMQHSADTVAVVSALQDTGVVNPDTGQPST